MKKSTWGILILILASAVPAFARTRQTVIDDAAVYSTHNWIPSDSNILDVTNHFAVLGTTFTPQSGGDGYDDRAFKRNTKTNMWEYSTASWPFVVGSSVTGEAYAWAGYSAAGLWGADTTTQFSLRLNTSGKWIAGKASEDALPGGYAGFTGLDCSGFVGNSLDISRYATDGYKFSVTQIKDRAISVKFENAAWRYIRLQRAYFNVSRLGNKI